LIHGERTAADPTITSEPYQQIIAVFDTAGAGVSVLSLQSSVRTCASPSYRVVVA
jgi:hypothetical protein